MESVKLRRIIEQFFWEQFYGSCINLLVFFESLYNKGHQTKYKILKLLQSPMNFTDSNWIAHLFPFFLYVSINNKNSCLTHDKSPVTIIPEKHKNKIWCWLGSRDDGRVMFCSLFFSFIFFLVGSQQNVMGKKKNFDGFCLRPNFHFHFHLG